jgi:hypothetical protein
MEEVLEIFFPTIVSKCPSGVCTSSTCTTSPASASLSKSAKRGFTNVIAGSALEQIQAISAGASRQLSKVAIAPIRPQASRIVT